MSNLINTWLTPKHSLFFIKQFWYRFRYKRYFDTIEKFPLSVKQRQSIIVDEKRNLVIAGAGTGKTSTVVGKVGYLVKFKKVIPNEILVIAYNRNAAKELKNRINDKLKIEVEVGTFHSIGKSILYQSNHANRPHQFVDQEEKLIEFLDYILQKCLKNKDLINLYLEYFKKYEFRNVDEVRDFKTMSEYANWLKINKLLTLNKERVKSHGELLIANFLHCNGIEYKYESYYSPQNSMPFHANYKPDFFLPKYNIYLEYFGIDENGNTANYISTDEYKKSMRWKFHTHKMGNTKLIDLYYFQKKKGKLQEVLEKELRNLNVEFNPIPEKYFFKIINNTEKDKKFLTLIKRFLDQFKERQNSLSLDYLINSVKDDERSLLFLKIFKIILNAYQLELTKDKKIDFGDMISKSASLVSSRKELSRYKYIIIDEFQDISYGRYDLIIQLLKQNNKTKLFCVGDDWQAIYRFAGSDHKIMTNFQSMFGKSTILKLDKTFRYNNQIASVSEKFITKNPSQIKKNIKTLTFKETPQVFIHWYSENILTAVMEALKAIIKEYSVTDKTLLILSRYNHNKLDDDKLYQIKDTWQGGDITQRTVHSAKGLEADFVIISDLNSDYPGFPSEIEDDPLLNLVLSNEDKFEDSEERRLLYVALTRAKNQTHLICNSISPSRFAIELSNEEYSVVVKGNADSGKKCPACNDGIIIKKISNYGEYYSCYNYPLCDFKPMLCSCQNHFVLREKTIKGNEIAICQSTECKKTHQVCDTCTVGVYKEISGPNYLFLGCHDFQRTKCKGKKEIYVKLQKNKFEELVLNFKNYISDINFSDDYDFYVKINSNYQLKIITIKISFNLQSKKTDFLDIDLNLDELLLEIYNKNSVLIDFVKFKSYQDILLSIDNKIINSRNLIGIAHPINNKKSQETI